jgi:sirohydrochlorin ferrochelatase
MLNRSPGTSVLVVAHGERGGAAINETVVRLAQGLAARHVANEVGCGFIKGHPTVCEALEALRSPEVLIYPLLLSDGYFASIVLPRLLREATSDRSSRLLRVLPAMGLDPGLSELVVAQASALAVARGLDLRQTTLLLLAHGSPRDPASERATKSVARAASRLARFASVHAAFLDQRPTLVDVAMATRGPAVIVGLFAGEGRHGADDVRKLMAALRRNDLFFAGNVVSFPWIANLVAAGIARASARRYGGPTEAPQVPEGTLIISMSHVSPRLPRPGRSAGR